MELHELQAFVVLADCLCFSEAANRLHIAQPALSKKIQKLERELGGKLFSRAHNRVALTPTGQRFHRDVVFILHEIGEAVLRAKPDAGDAKT